MLKHGDIIKINLKPYFNNVFFYGKIIDYSYIFDTGKFNIFVHVFENLYDINRGPKKLFTNPIQIRKENIYLEYEKRIAVVDQQTVNEDEFVRNMMFRSGSILFHNDLIFEYSIEDFELGLSTLEFEFPLKTVANLELIDFHTLYTIVERISVQKMITNNISLDSFNSSLSKNSLNNLKDIYRYYEGSTPYQKQSFKKRNTFFIDWSIIKNSRYRSPALEKKYGKEKSRYEIFFDFQFEFWLYDPIFSKYNFRATSYYWAAVIYEVVNFHSTAIGDIVVEKVNFYVLDNTRFIYRFNTKVERDLVFDYLLMHVAKPTKVEKWLRLIVKNKDLLDFVLYKHPANEEEKKVEESIVEVISHPCKYRYISLFTYHQSSKTEYGIEIIIDSNAFSFISNGDRIVINGEMMREKVTPIIKNLLGLKRSNFVIDEDSDSAVIIFRKEEDYETIKSYLLNVFDNKKSREKWLQEYFS